MSGIESHRRQGSGDWQLEDVRGRGDRVVVAYSWRAPDGSRARWAQLLTVKGGKIVGMRDYASPARALRADEEYFKEITVGDQVFPRYSQMAIERLLAAKDEEDMDAIWDEYRRRHRVGRR